MAGDAGPARQVIVPIHVALGTWQRGVGAGESETGCRVIETRASPTRGVVTVLAGLRKFRLHVIRVGCALIVLQVARHALRAR